MDIWIVKRVMKLGLSYQRELERVFGMSAA
jgi:hypothetical protein